MIISFIGATELLLIGSLALLLVGGKKIPEMMRGLGKGVRSFKEGMNEITQSDTQSSLENKISTESEKARGQSHNMPIEKGESGTIPENKDRDEE